jgi:hypothetical protein
LYLKSIKVRVEVKQVPRILTRLIRAMYGRKCMLHSHVMNREHLAEAHNETIDPIALIRKYGQESFKRLVKLRLREGLTRIDSIAAP